MAKENKKNEDVNPVNEILKNEETSAAQKIASLKEMFNALPHEDVSSDKAYKIVFNPAETNEHKVKALLSL